MLNHELQVYYLLKKLRYRYRDELASSYSDFTQRVCDADNLLFNIYNSIPIVYLDADVNLPEFIRVSANRANQKSRTKKYLQKMFRNKNDLFFVTLTFDDAALLLKPEVRRKYVLRWCKENCFDYYGNIDYGIQKQREHYHVLCDLRQPYDMWNYGFMYAKPVNKGGQDLKRINTYLHKFVNHANKLTTGSSFHKRKTANPSVEVYDLSIFEN